MGGVDDGWQVRVIGPHGRDVEHGGCDETQKDRSQEKVTAHRHGVALGKDKDKAIDERADKDKEHRQERAEGKDAGNGSVDRLKGTRNEAHQEGARVLKNSARVLDAISVNGLETLFGRRQKRSRKGRRHFFVVEIFIDGKKFIEAEN